MVTKTVLEEQLLKKGYRFNGGTVGTIIEALVEVYPEYRDTLNQIEKDNNTPLSIEDGLKLTEFKVRLESIVDRCLIRHMHRIITGERTFNSDVEVSLQVVFEHYKAYGADRINNIIGQLNSITSEQYGDYMSGLDRKASREAQKKLMLQNRNMKVEDIEAPIIPKF